MGFEECKGEVLFFFLIKFGFCMKCFLDFELFFVFDVVFCNIFFIWFFLCIFFFFMYFLSRFGISCSYGFFVLLGLFFEGEIIIFGFILKFFFIGI